MNSYYLITMNEMFSGVKAEVLPMITNTANDSSCVVADKFHTHMCICAWLHGMRNPI